MTKKLYRSEDHKAIAGILGGVAEYFQIDPVLPRLMFVLITLATGVFPAVIVYIIGWIVIPLKATPMSEQKKEPIHVVIHEVKKEEEKKGDDQGAV